MPGLFHEPVFSKTKPDFGEIPKGILDKIEVCAGESVVSGETAYGGISAGASFVLFLSSGRKIFAKGSHPGEMAHGTKTIRQEISAYRDIVLLKTLAPEFLGEVSDGNEDGWFLGLWRYIERDLSPPSVPRMIYRLAEWHSTPVDGKKLRNCSEQNFIRLFFEDHKKWRKIRDEDAVRKKFISLFGDPEAGGAWLERNINALCAAQAAAGNISSPQGLLHGDLRLDNVFSAGGKIYVVDWPNACFGPVLFDLLFLFSDLEGLGIAPMEECLDLYRHSGGFAFNDEARVSLAAALAGYFADQAYREVPVKLPRLRWKQKSQLLALLKFLARAGMLESIPGMAEENR